MNKLYSCADWMEVEGLLPTICTTHDRQVDAYPASIKSFTSFHVASSATSFDRRSQLTIMDQRVSLQKSIEEFNAIIDADMGLTSSSLSVALHVTPLDYSEPECAQSRILGAFLLTQFSSLTPMQEIKYGWSPFDEGEFQFAVIDDPTL